MSNVIYAKPGSRLALVLQKMEADKKMISEHLNKGGKLSELRGRIGIHAR